MFSLFSGVIYVRSGEDIINIFWAQGSIQNRQPFQ
jgi:hypothetical protein